LPDHAGNYMTGRMVGPNAPSPMISIPIHGGTDASRVARHAVLSRLDGRVSDESANDIALIVSELVANSVLHANVGEDDSLLVELAVTDGRLAIAVTDPGSDQTPRLLPRDPTKPKGLGLHLVDRISASWGVSRHPGATRVWCELALGEPGGPQLAATPARE
jgi:anti-sigma regulatory factor (Ser/Thr protein kinase)